MNFPLIQERESVDVHVSRKYVKSTKTNEFTFLWFLLYYVSPLPLRAMSGNNTREKSEIEHFQKSHFSQWLRMMEYISSEELLFHMVQIDGKCTFPEVIIFDGAT